MSNKKNPKHCKLSKKTHSKEQKSAETTSDPHCRLFVGGFQASINRNDLFNHFSKFGEILNAQIMYDKKTGKSRSFGFIECKDRSVAERILGLKHKIRGRDIDVNHAFQKGNKDTSTNWKKLLFKKKLFVTNLPDFVSSKDLEFYFSGFGSLRKAYIITDPLKNKPKGFGYVEFFDLETLNKVLDVKNHQIKGHRIMCFRYKHKDQQRTANKKGGFIPNKGNNRRDGDFEDQGQRQRLMSGDQDRHSMQGSAGWNTHINSQGPGSEEEEVEFNYNSTYGTRNLAAKQEPVGSWQREQSQTNGHFPNGYNAAEGIQAQRGYFHQGYAQSGVYPNHRPSDHSRRDWFNTTEGPSSGFHQGFDDYNSYQNPQAPTFSKDTGYGCSYSQGINSQGFPPAHNYQGSPYQRQWSYQERPTNHKSSYHQNSSYSPQPYLKYRDGEGGFNKQGFGLEPIPTNKDLENDYPDNFGSESGIHYELSQRNIPGRRDQKNQEAAFNFDRQGKGSGKMSLEDSCLKYLELDQEVRQGCL